MEESVRSVEVMACGAGQKTRKEEPEDIGGAKERDIMWERERSSGGELKSKVHEKRCIYIRNRRKQWQGRRHISSNEKFKANYHKEPRQV